LNFLEQLEASDFSHWVSVSMAGFPTLIALHSVGMAVMVGLSLMVTLRLHRVITGFRLELIPRLLQVAAWGFLLNLVTGLGIFITRGPEYLASAMFLCKMLLVAVGAALTFWLGRQLGLRPSMTEQPAIRGVAKRVSLLATVAWFGAVIAGRLIAYLSDLYR
jgi:hypothetical protein